MLVALDGRPEWLAFAAGGYYAAEPSLGRFNIPWRLHDAIAYGMPVLIVAVGWLIRNELARRAVAAEPRGPPAELTGPGARPGLVRELEPDPAFAADVGREVPV